MSNDGNFVLVFRHYACKHVHVYQKFVVIFFFLGWLVVFVNLSSLPVAHLSDAPQKTVSCYVGIVQGYSTKLLRAQLGSLTCSMYSTVTRDIGLKSHPKDN